MIFPEPLKKGDKIAIISPASAVKDEYVAGAMEKIMEYGYEPVLMEHALGHVTGSFAASQGERLTDLIEAIQNPRYKAIFCSRGGYGCTQLISGFPHDLILANPKWIIGFSDISALLALWIRCGVASVHGPMAKHLAQHPTDDACSLALINLLESGGSFDYEVIPHKYNRPGRAKGTIRGGNLAVLNDLANTPADILEVASGEEVILFIEDIAEPIYAVNRMLWRLRNAGILNKLKGLVFGKFTEYKSDRNFESMEDMLKEFIQDSELDTEIPVVFDFPVGHTEINLPLTEGATVELTVTPEKVRLKSL